MNKVEIESSIKYYVGLVMKNLAFQFNDQFNRDKLVYKVVNFLSLLKEDSALSQYYVVCDETNNTPLIIDMNQLKVKVYIKYFDSKKEDDVMKNLYFTLKASDKKDDDFFKFMIEVIEEEMIQVITTENRKTENLYLRY